MLEKLAFIFSIVSIVAFIFLPKYFITSVILTVVCSYFSTNADNYKKTMVYVLTAVILPLLLLVYSIIIGLVTGSEIKFDTTVDEVVPIELNN